MYEIMGNGGANTMRRTIGGTGPGGAAPDAAPTPDTPVAPAPAAAPPDAPGRGGRGGGITAREWYRPLPPPRDLLWSIRNNTNYSESAVLAALELTASIPKTVLENFYLKSRNSIDSG